MSLVGIASRAAINTAPELTNREAFCIYRHEMRDNLYRGHQDTMKGRTDKTLFRSAALLVVAAAVLYGLYGYFFAGIEWTPLRVPVELAAGRDHGGEFITRWSVVYEIRLDTDRNLGLQEQNCLLGIESVVPERCAGVLPELILSWQVESDGDVIADGASSDSQAGYWGPTMGKILGAFQAAAGKRYRVAVNVGRSSPALQRANPRLLVTVTPRERKGTYVWSGLLVVFASGLLLLAIVLPVIQARRSMGQRGD